MDLVVPSKKKGIAFSSQLKENESDVESDDDNALFVKKFKKVFRNNKNSRSSEEIKSPRFQRNPKGTSAKKYVQCYNCKGFGHIAQNCSTSKESEKGDRKGQKVLNITWDEEDEGSGNNESQNDEDENISNWPLFTSIEESNQHNTLIDDTIGKEETKDENEMNEIQQAYDELYENWENKIKKNKVLREEFKRLVIDNNDLKDELKLKIDEKRNLELESSQLEKRFIIYNLN